MTLPDCFQWDEDQQELRFYGKPATLFWQDPSLACLLYPLKEELGEAYFFLLIAYSASQHSDDDYQQMHKELSEDFAAGLQAWGNKVTKAGWGQVVQVDIHEGNQSATIVVDNPWELNIFPDSKTQYALPFLCGKLSGLFSNHFSRPMRAHVSQIDRFHQHLRVVIRVKTSQCTLRSELQQLVKQEGFSKEEKLLFMNKQLQQKAIELESANRKLQELDTRDDLTGLYNRRHLMELTQREFHVCRRYKYPSSLVMFDIDHFRHINEAHGHLAGDEVLRQVAGVCKSVLRKTDLCDRIGGEEFLIMLPHTDQEGATIITQRLANLVEHLAIEYGGHTIKQTISAGISEIIEQDKLLDDWIKRVDDLMYQAKNRGHNQIAYYRPD